MPDTVLTTVVVPAALAGVMLGLGLTLVPSDFKRVAGSPRAIALGLACQLALLPALGLGIALLSDLDAKLALALVVVSLCPGGVFSNAICNLVRADLPLSVSLTAISSLVTPVTIPILYAAVAALWGVHDASLDLPVGRTVIQLVAISVLPIAFGMMLRVRFPRVAETAERPVRVLSVMLFVAVIAGVISQNWFVLRAGFQTVGTAALVLNVSAQALAIVASRMFRLGAPQASTLAIEIGLQNAATARFVTATLLGDSTMSIVPAVYAIVMVPGALAGGYARMRLARPRLASS